MVKEFEKRAFAGKQSDGNILAGNAQRGPVQQQPAALASGASQQPRWMQAEGLTNVESAGGLVIVEKLYIVY